MDREYIIESIDFSEEEYNAKVAGQDGVATFDEFIDNIIRATEENNGLLEDAIFIANDAYNRL